MRFGLLADLREGLGDGCREQAPAVLGEARRVENRPREREAHEPAQQEVVLKLLDAAPLGRDRIEDLDELCA